MGKKAKVKGLVKPADHMKTCWVSRFHIEPSRLEQADQYRHDFNSCKYTLVQKILNAEEIDKPQLCDYFHLPSRLYNAALTEAEASISSVKELADDHKYRLERKHKEVRQWVQLMKLDRLMTTTERRRWDKLRGKKQVQEWEKWDREAAKPSICFGKEILKERHKVRTQEQLKAWERECDIKRYGHFGAMGGKDEEGNRTFRLVYQGKNDRGKGCFKVYHQQELFGIFTLNEDRSSYLAAYLTEKKALQVMFFRHDAKRKNRWHIHLTLREDILPTITDAIGGMIGMDSNHSMFCWSRLGPSGRILEYSVNEFSESDTKELRAVQIEERLRNMVDVAKKHRIPIAIEALNLEGRKRGKNSRRCNRAIHGMPYRKIREILMRLCARAQVELIEVWAAYSSLLGAFVSGKYPRLSRDVAASVILAYRGFAARGVTVRGWKKWLSEQTPLRFNVKGVMGHTITLRLDPQQRSMLEEMTDAQVGRLLAPAFRQARNRTPGHAYAEQRCGRLRLRFAWKPNQASRLGTVSLKRGCVASREATKLLAQV